MCDLLVVGGVCDFGVICLGLVALCQGLRED